MLLEYGESNTLQALVVRIWYGAIVQVGHLIFGILLSCSLLSLH